MLLLFPFLLLLSLLLAEPHVISPQLACEGYPQVFQAPHLWRAPVPTLLGQATGTGLVVVLGEHLCQLLLVKVGVKLCLRLLYLVEVVVQCLVRKHVGLSFF